MAFGIAVDNVATGIDEERCLFVRAFLAGMLFERSAADQQPVIHADDFWSI